MNNILRIVLTALVLSSLAMPFQALAITYNANVTAIYGSGNGNGGWTEQSSFATGQYDVQVALRAKNTSTGATPNNGAGVYTFTSGENWNFDFSYNSDLNNNNFWQLGAFKYSLSVDIDPSAGTNFVTFSPTLYTDNSYGDSATANGAGVEGLYAANSLSNSLMQNSQNLGFFPFNGDDNQIGTYDITASIMKLDGTVISNVGIKVNVVGAQGVAEHGNTVALLAMALVGMGLIRHVGRKTALTPSTA